MSTKTTQKKVPMCDFIDPEKRIHKDLELTGAENSFSNTETSASGSFPYVGQPNNFMPASGPFPYVGQPNNFMPASGPFPCVGQPNNFMPASGPFPCVGQPNNSMPYQHLTTQGALNPTTVQPALGTQLQGLPGNPTAFSSNETPSKRNQRNKTCAVINPFADGSWHLVEFLNNGTLNDKGIVFENLYGTCNIFILTFSKFSGMKRHFLLQFSNGSILGKCGSPLKKAFLQAGVHLISSGSDKKIEEAIDNYFCPLIKTCPNLMIFPERAQWIFEGYRASFRWLLPTVYCVQEFMDFPINHKKFATLSNDFEWYEEYFQMYTKIEDQKTRSLLMILPVAGLLGSWLRKNGYPNLILNVIVRARQDVSKLSNLASVFDRHRNNFILADSNVRQLADKIYAAHNDTLLVDARCVPSDNQNSIKKKQRAVEKIVSYYGRRILNEFPELDIETEGAVLIVNTEQLFDDAVVNIFLEPQFFEKIRISGDVIGMFLIDFVSWAEANSSIIEGILNVEETQVTETIECLLRVLTSYWTSKGVQTGDDLSLEEYMRFSLDDSVQLNSVDAFIRLVRRNARFYSGTTDRNMLLEGFVFFDSEYIIFPSTVFFDLIEKGGLMRRKNELLLELQKNDLLISDSEGYSKRKMINGTRIETYVIKQSVFYEIGAIDVRALFGR